jgi:N-acetylneuraminic acid mutarotase
MMIPFSYKSIFKKAISNICFVTAFLIFSSNYNAQTWTGADPVPLQRHSSAAVLLQDGRVFKTGGYMLGGTGCSVGATNQCEVYNTLFDQWSTVSAMTNSRRMHTATLLNSGEVLVTGGICGGSTVEKYDPITGAWTIMTPMSVARARHTATLLNDGRVMVIGGDGNSDPPAGRAWTRCAV